MKMGIIPVGGAPNNLALPQIDCMKWVWAGMKFLACNSTGVPIFLPFEPYFLFAVFMVAQAVATAAVAVALPEKTAVIASPNAPQ